MASKERLKRQLEKDALNRLEQSARKEEDYYALISIYDRLDDRRERKERRYEINTERIMDKNEGLKKFRGQLLFSDTVIPPIFNHMWWRQLMRGDFLDFIHDCPYELEELTSNSRVYNELKDLNENQKEVLYLWIIKQWSPQRIAKYREQTDRNIRKIYVNTIDDIR